MDEEVERVRQLIRAVSARVPVDAAALLAGEPLDRIAEVLGRLPKRLVRDILEHLPPESRPMDPMSITTEMMVPGTVADLMADRKSVVEGKRVSVRVELGGRGSIKKKKEQKY